MPGNTSPTPRTGRPKWLTRLDRHYLYRVIGAMARILVSLVLLTAIIDLLLARQDNISKYSIPLWAVFSYYITLTPTILFEYHAAAISVLLAGLFVLGRAAQDNEFTALHSGGVSLLRAARAPLAGALLFAVAIFAFQETLGVKAARVFEDISQRYFSKMSGGVGKGFSRIDLEGWSLHVLTFNRRALSGRDVFLHRMGSDALEEIRARRIYWDDR
ncbi:MAG TPA: LptF/LptG family permease, partial [Candidatus Hydrogenedentes bacterium]|nr:LptF/LptG family permease [Candidatus Hydrogenedentota bacterium]